MTPSSPPPEEPAERPVVARPMRSRGERIGLALLSLLVFLGLAELGLRLFAPQDRSWLPIYRRHPRVPIYALAPHADARKVTGEVDFRVTTDGRGQRVAPERMYAAEPPGARDHVLWLGDSFTFGYGVDYAESMVGRVAAATPEGLAHHNLGAPGYGPMEYTYLFRDYLESGERPAHVVVTYFVGNDYQDANASKDHQVVAGLVVADRGLRGVLKTRLHLYRLLAKVWHQFGFAGEGRYRDHVAKLAREETWRSPQMVLANKRIRSSLDIFLGLAQEYGVEVHYVVLPTEEAVRFLHSEDELAPEGGDPTLPSRRLVEMLEARGVEPLDMLPILAEHEPDELYFVFDGHFRPFGYGVCAEAILERWPELAGG